MGNALAARPWGLIATCSRGLEGVVQEELRALGHSGPAAGPGTVRFSGDFAAVMRANLWLRSAMRVLLTLGEGPVANRDELYGLAASLAWEELLGPGQTFAVEVAGRTPAFASSAFAALTVKDAIADRLRRRWGGRPDVDRRTPDILVHLHLGARTAALALDASGEPLSHRGYRPRGGPAPLSEALAAGILELAGYDGSRPFLDPMCGTGTLAIEAALIATCTAPGLGRTFACERWVFAEPGVAEALRRGASERRRASRVPIVATDLDPRAVAAARRNARAAGVGDAVRVAPADVVDLEVPGPATVIVSNPPYGRRLGKGEDLSGLYRRFGDALKRRAADCTAWLLVGDRDLIGSTGLRPSRRIVLFNGPIECRLLRFDLFPGKAPRPGRP